MQSNSQYDFMLNPDPKNSGPLYKGGKKRLALGIAFVIFCLIIVTVIGSIILSPDNSGNERLVRLEAHQTEIDRVIALGQKNLIDPEIKKQLATYQSSVITDKKQISDLLSLRSYQPEKGATTALLNSRSDSALTGALQTDTHDQELVEIVESLTNKYYSDLTTARTNAESNREKAILDVAIANIETIYKTD